MARSVEPAQAAFAAANVLALALFTVVVSLPGSGDEPTQASASRTSASDAPGTPVLYVTGPSHGDHLVGRSAAAAVGGQVRMIAGAALDGESRAEVAGLAPARVVLVGGPAAVSDRVLEELRSLTTRPVTRVAGADRYATAALLALGDFRPPVSRVVVHSGAAPADVRQGPPPNQARGPALLVDGSRVPPRTAEALRVLRPRSIVVQGGPAEVPDAVVAALGAFTEGTVSRSE